MFKRILIANRGEIAARIIRACRELGISPVVVYSEADAKALHVRMADEAVLIGPPAATQSYLRAEAIVEAALQLNAQAIHPGYGFLSESVKLAEQCAAAGVTFIGPPPAAIAAMGGKAEARALAQAAGVPVVPGYDGDDQSDERLLAEARRIGPPLLIKASAGGGGKGMRSVGDLADVPAALEGARREARAAFGDDRLIIERLVLRPRHVEIQVLADRYGNVVHLGERDCSIQRRHQKVVEEAPSPALTPALREAMGRAAVSVARAAGYVNAGTVEFILTPDGEFYFLEMNTRLQVEHPVTELVCGYDLVHLQIAIAAGEPLPFHQEEITARGHAIEVRLYAEDPRAFLPAAGKVLLFVPPQGPGVRVDAGLSSGDEVTVHYDPMIAKIIVAGANRQQAVTRLRRALREMVVLGPTTNLPLLQAIAEHPAFTDGATHTGFLAEHEGIVPPPGPPPREVLIAAAILSVTTDPPPRDPLATVWRLGGDAIPLTFNARGEHRLRVIPQTEGWRVAGDKWSVSVKLIHRGDYELALMLDNQCCQFFFARADDGWLIAWRGESHHLRRPAPLTADSVTHAVDQHAASFNAPMPGTIVRLHVAVGEQVREGQPLLVLEAMKMEHTVVAPYPGVVRRLPYSTGASVAAGAQLVEIEPLAVTE
ncbi:acetyl/propionyl/methylcrotonyl-CoA carboxylase subunit alpha [Chloroflexus sp.]|uniref:acetyl/propionyl/methylcrotonyl-CoA carboxylase subunit alpha n=1 Tax=Chloroflexus sp. TaxID=1904827 RepID=UPI002620C246|nr:acetyl-CoA carboxylase biotin carboxylase subunit [uncultured Chloroflexus sp.]